MKKLLVLLLLAAAPVVLIAQTSAAQTKILSAVGDDSEYYKFASMLRAANMGATLSALGTYTVFAPDNIVFRDMASTRLDSLTGDNAKLVALLKAHIVKGKFTTTDIIKKLTLGKGKTTLTNLLGQPLRLSRTKENKLLITGPNGTTSSFLAFDMADAKSVTHGIDNLLVK